MQKLLEQFNIFFENRKIIEKFYKDTSGGILHDYNINEMHCIHFIGELENPNVTKLAVCLNISKAAVSRMIKNFCSKNLIHTYTQENNKKEIYYTLTRDGQKIYDAHKKIHEIWNREEIGYLKTFSQSRLDSVLDFLTEYNKKLETKIKSIK